MNKFYVLFLCAFISSIVSAQQLLLDAVTHPKFQNPVPNPTKINLGTATTIMQMAQTTQNLGLVDAANMPLQTKVWGYGLNGGTVSYPGPTLVANSNSVANVEWRNNLPTTHLLPIDMTYHKAMPTSGIPTVVHLHGGHTEAASDGHAKAWYTPNYAEKGTAWAKSVYQYDNTQEGATIWYHDHTLGMTRLNVYAGLAGFYLIKDANDQALSLPRNEYDRELVVQDRIFDNTGQLYLPTDPTVVNGGVPEFFGDFILVNGMAWPFMEVEPRKYRFRLLNGSDSRVYVFKLSNGATFLQIGTDDGKLNNPQSLTELTLAPGERSEIIIDFSTMNGQQITLINGGSDTPFGNPASVPVDPTSPTGQIMQFWVNLPLNSAIPDVNITTATDLRPNLGPIQDIGAPMKTRKLALFEGTDDLGRILPMLGIVDPTNPNDGSLLWHDPVTENVNLNDTEIWEVYNTTADAHPIHVHLVSFQILSKQTFTGTLTDKMQMMHSGGMGMGSTLSNIVLTGTPQTFAPADLGWKDTHILMPGEMMRIKARFDRTGEYVWHCHILSHEDHDMMRKLVVGGPCAGDNIPPVLTSCPANITLTTTGTTAIASWTEPTATDNCTAIQPTVSYTTSPTTGLTNSGVFPLGQTTVNYMAMDDNNNMSTCSFTVNVQNQTVPPTCANNLLTNSSFENDLTNWQTSNTPTSNTVVIGTTANTGSNALEICTGNGFASQIIDGTPNTTYNLSYYGKISGAINYAEIGIEFKDINFNLLNYDASINQKPITSTSYTNGVLSLISPPGTAKVQVTISAGTGGCAFLDDFCLTTQAVDPCPNPTITCPSNQTLTTAGAVTWADPTPLANCGTPTLTFTTSPTANLKKGDIFPAGTTTIDYMGMFPNGKMAMCSFTVTVPQVVDPCPNPTITCPSNQTLTTTDAVTWADPTPLANCGTPTLTFTTSPTLNLKKGDIFPVGTTTVSYMGMFPNGKMAMCSFTVTVPQVVDPCPNPTITCPSNQTLTTTDAVTWADPTPLANCGTPTLTFTTSPTANLKKGDIFPVGTTTVSYMGMFPNGKMAMCSFTVTVPQVVDPCLTEITPPTITCPANVVKSTTNNQCVTLSPFPLATATDNCPGTPSVTSNRLASFCFPVGVTSVTDTATDARGNKSFCTFTVTVNNVVVDPCLTETTPPTITCPANVIKSTTNNQCVTLSPFPLATATDNCPGIPSVTANKLASFCFPVGVTSVTDTATDARGNKSFCSFTVSVNNVVVDPCLTETTPPTINCPANVVKSTTNNQCVTLSPFPLATATDNCPGTPSVTSSKLASFCFPIGVTSVTDTATDARGNKSFCTFTVTVNNVVVDPCLTETTPPTITCPANVVKSTTNNQCVTLSPFPLATANDNCPGTPSVTSSKLASFCFPVGVTSVTDTATDARGNKSFCTFTVTVNNAVIDPCLNDAIAPVFASCPTNISLTTTGTTANATWIAPTATDNCTAYPTITYSTSPTLGLLNGGAFPVGSTTVTYKAKDAKGLTTTCSFVVTVVKQTLGTIGDFVWKDNNGNGLQDLGEPGISNVQVQLLTSARAVLATAFTDANGKYSFTGLPSTTYIIKYKTPVGYLITLRDANLNLSNNIDSDIDPNGEDIITLGNNEINLTKDAGYKPDPCYKETIPPVFSGCPTNISLTTSSNSTICSWIEPKATDNCSIPSVSYTTSPTVGLIKGAAFPKGVTTVTYTATDGNGNKATCSFTVTVIDACTAFSNSAVTEYFINNTWYTGSSVTVNAGTSLTLSANPNSLVSYIWTGPLGYYKIGNSGGDALVSSAISTAQAGTYYVTLKDSKGCTATKSINVIVNDPCGNDKTPPIFTYCPPTVSVPVGLLSWCKSATWTTPTATDNCGTPAVVQVSGQYKGSCFTPGTYAISYKATDTKGNISYCNFNVYAYKTLSLFLEGKDNLVMDAQAEVNRTYIEWVNNTGFKNDYFTVEKINNATGNFETLETVNSQSSDSSTTHYSTYDNAPNEGDNTYRVKVTFQDGSTKISESKTLNFKGLYDVRIFPNPASDVVGIDLSSYKNQAVEISMYNYLGQQISVQKVEKVGNAVVELNVANLQEGNYMIRIQAKGKRDITKIVNITH